MLSKRRVIVANLRNKLKQLRPTVVEVIYEIHIKPTKFEVASLMSH